MPRPAATTGPAQAPASTDTPARLPIAVLVLALLGVALAVDLWVLHYRVHAGAGPTFCDIDERVSCSDVARSPWSAFLGVPVAAWGALAYLTVALLAASALGRRRRGPWPAGLLFALTGLMTVTAVALAAVSELVIRKFCVMCAGSWAVTLALLAISAVLMRRAGGIRAALASDLSALRQHKVPAAVSVAVLAAMALAMLATYAWARPKEPLPAGHLIPPGPPGTLIVYEYSDYLCPHCAYMHGRERSIIASRPDVRFVRRNYPLDNACNARVPTTMHPGSCALARGGICAEELGQFEAYDDAAFAAQEARLTPEQLAQQIGLDLPAFRECLSSPETAERLASDIRSGDALGVRGTPSYEVQGKLLSIQALYAILGLKPDRVTASGK
ncbi:MAG TPA: vitamin K epoxide reductase family protein [Anaeromyxobacter sp.]|nr:vitamin K epoxide reductase family protein [Anaeromyxobacter sp.]